MEQQQDMAQSRSDQPGAASGVAVGAALRDAREAMGLSVDEVAGRLKFAPRQIEALEAGNFGQLPEIAFVRGFVRAYARLVQVDELPLLGALPGAPAAAAVQVRATAREVPRQGSESRKQNLFWIGGALLVIVLGIIAWKYDAGDSTTKDKQTVQSTPAETAGQPATTQGTDTMRAAEPAANGGTAPAEGAAQSAGTVPPSVTKRAESTHVPESNHITGSSRTAAAPSAAPEPAPAPVMPRTHKEAAPTVAPSSAKARVSKGIAPASGVSANGASEPRAVGLSRMVHLEFSEDSWVEVTDGTGRILLSMLGAAGTSRNAAGQTPLTVVVGNAKGVKLFYKGQPVELKPAAGSDVARLKLE